MLTGNSEATSGRIGGYGRRVGTGRARSTNDPKHIPGINPHSPQARRCRDLVKIFIEALGGRAAVTDLQLIAVRKAAELTGAAESARAQVLAGKSADLAGLVKIEGEARRAVRALGIKSGSAPHVPLRERLAKEAAQASREPA